MAVVAELRAPVVRGLPNPTSFPPAVLVLNQTSSEKVLGASWPAAAGETRQEVVPLKVAVVVVSRAHALGARWVTVP